MNGTYYLNNNGSRWVTFENGRRVSITLETKSGKKITRRVNFFSSFGNFGTANISYNGKRIDVFLDQILEN